MLYFKMQMQKSDKPNISKGEYDGILIILQLEELINETVRPQNMHRIQHANILHFKSIWLNISPAALYLKINAVMFGNAFLQSRRVGEKDTI